MTPFREAQEIINSFARSFGVERIGIDKALSRILAEEVNADRDYPPFNRSAMDGIAIDKADFDTGLRKFFIAETIYAGQVSEIALSPGQCYKIMTGSAVPLSANVVIRIEDIEQSGMEAIIHAENCAPFQNIARKGHDLKFCQQVLKPGIKCTPVVVSLLASLGKVDVLVEKIPKVAIITTGNEVVPIDEVVLPVQIRNSNTHLLKALLLQKGIAPIFVEHVKDDKEQLYNAFKIGLEADILIINGGVSAGDADFVPQVLESLQVEKLFHKVAIRPGKPFWCGRMPSGRMVFALPGNPYSCMATYKLFIEPYITVCQGAKLPEMQSYPLQLPRVKKVSLDEFFPVKISGNPAHAEQLEINGSGDIRLGLEANALALHPRYVGLLESGQYVECLIL